MSDQRASVRGLPDSTRFRHQNRSVVAQIILYTALIAGTGNPILAQDQSNRNASAAAVRGKIDALLGGYEHAASPDEWRSLGSAAPAILAAIASNQNALPTRRARSRALRPPSTPRRHGSAPPQTTPTRPR